VPAVEEVVIPVEEAIETAEEVVQAVQEDSNPATNEEVAAEVLETTPELLTNPISASLDFLGITETDPTQYDTIASFYQSAISDTTLLAKTKKKLATEVAWCAAFANYILNDVGIETKQMLEDYDTKYARVRAKNFIDLGTPVYNSSKNTKKDLQSAKIGSLVVKKGEEGYHVGFFAGINPDNEDEVLILGGNQNDEVNVTTYPLKQIVTINSLENVQEADSKVVEKISKDIKESGATR
tara:strand:+ start:3919 stop:4635 length:717 start_codon:yes stop_codon:yes gene_type:complete